MLIALVDFAQISHHVIAIAREVVQTVRVLVNLNQSSQTIANASPLLARLVGDGYGVSAVRASHRCVVRGGEGEDATQCVVPGGGPDCRLARPKWIRRLIAAA